jgi:short-subunit dehydrogenase
MTSPLRGSIPALVTGASSGIGAEIARQLAARGHALTLVARRRDRLEQLAEELRDSHGTVVDVLGADLEKPTDVATVAERLATGAPWLLVNNAGFGSHGRIWQLDPEREAAEIAVNVVALQRLTLAVLPGNRRAHDGGIVNVASTAAFQAVPYMSTYAATKAFVLSFTEGLSVELRGSGVRVMALCPGPVRTEFSDVAGGAEFERISSMAMPISVEACVRSALRALDHGRTICIPGAQNHLTTIGARVTPRGVLRQVTAQIFKPR